MGRTFSATGSTATLLPGASLGVRTGVFPRCCCRAGSGLLDPTTALSSSTRTTNHITHHTHSRLLASPPGGGQALLDHGISQLHLIS
jgi:hypothetical protein